MGLITFINVAIGVSLVWFIIYHLAGTLFLVVSVHSLFYWVMAMAMTFFLDREKEKEKTEM